MSVRYIVHFLICFVLFQSCRALPLCTDSSRLVALSETCLEIFFLVLRIAECMQTNSVILMKFLFLSHVFIAWWAAWPTQRNYSLAFCGFTELTCCNASDDSGIMAKFTAMNITDTSCASIIKSILCSV